MAKGKFVFKFQKILENKEKIEENAKNELAKANAQLEEEKRKLEKIYKEIEDEKEKTKFKPGQIVNIETLKLFRLYMQKKENDIQEQKKIITQWENIVQNKKNILIEATKERKVFEKLKEKYKKEYYEKMLKKEQNFIDEMAIQSFFKKERSDD